jgi:hypothetical protein
MIIDRLGGSLTLAAKLGRPGGTVAAWKHRKRIPPDAWTEVVTLAKRERVHGITFRVMLGLYGKAAA